MATLEQRLEAAHAATTIAVDNLLSVLFGTGDAVAAVEALQAIEAERNRLEAEYEAQKVQLRESE